MICILSCVDVLICDSRGGLKYFNFWFCDSQWSGDFIVDET